MWKTGELRTAGVDTGRSRLHSRTLSLGRTGADEVQDVHRKFKVSKLIPLLLILRDHTSDRALNYTLVFLSTAQVTLTNHSTTHNGFFHPDMQCGQAEIWQSHSHTSRQAVRWQNTAEAHRDNQMNHGFE